MKFRCDRDALSEALADRSARGVVAAGDPGAHGVSCWRWRGGTLTLTTTDLEVSARLAIDVQVSEPGVALVPARLLADTVKSLSPTRRSSSRRTSPRRGSAARRTRARCGSSRQRISRRCRSRAARGSKSSAARSPRPWRRWGAPPRGRGAAGAHGRAGRDSREGVCWRPRTRTGWRSGTWWRPRTARRRRSCPSGRCPRPGARRPPTRRATVEIWSTKPGVVPGRRAHAHVAPDRGRVPELPPAPARGAREPAHGVAPAAPGCGAARRSPRPRHDAGADGVQRARREALVQLEPGSRPSRRDGRGSVRGRGPNGGVQPAVPERRA